MVRTHRDENADRGSDDTIALSSRVPPNSVGVSLLEFLTSRFRYHDADAWSERIADGRITVGGRLVEPDYALARGEIVRYLRPAAEPDVPTDVRIVYDAGGIVVIDKPAGLPVHADGAFLTRTVVGVLVRELGEKPRPVQRLDRETSGLCVLARDRSTARALHAALAAREVEKTYSAIVHGVVEEDRFVVDMPIGRAPDSTISIRRATLDVGAPHADSAQTAFTVISRSERASLLRCQPRTGRTHQIRVHLEGWGYPIVGDKLYGRRDEEFLAWVAHVKAGGDAAWGGRLGAPRQMLHAGGLAFADPGSGARLVFEVAPPPDFDETARRLGLRS